MDNIEKSINHFFQRLGHTPGPWMNPPHDYEIMTVPRGDIKIGMFYSVTGRENDPGFANARMIVQSPAMLRTLCRTYLWMLTTLTYDNQTVTFRIKAQETLADLRNQISTATGIEGQQVQETFEQYALWIQLNQEIPGEKPVIGEDDHPDTPYLEDVIPAP